ncbi:MAG: hypothetical protein N2Z65_08035, partial [Clostridiales bacterium]|nr:hypothetical protein [Clostridiales bacterium]
MKKIHAVSYTKSIYCNFCNVPNRALTSVYGRFCARVSALFSSFAPAYTSSLFYRSCMAVSKFIKNIVLKSKVGVFLKHLTFRRLIIIAFTLSVFEDYFFRNIVKISFVASIWDEFIILAAFGYLVCRRASSSLPKISRVTPVDGYLLLFFGVGFFLMCVISPYPYIAFAGYRAVVEYMVWFFLMIRLVDNDGDFMTFFYTIIFLSLGMALHGIYQYIIAVPIPSGWVSHTEAGVRTRVFSIIGSPNILGSFFVLTAPMTASLAYYYKDIRIKIAAWCAVFLMCLSLLFTFSRGAWIGMAIAVFIFALFIDRRLIALMAAGASGALLLVPSIANRITYLFTADYVTASMTGGRMVRW